MIDCLLDYVDRDDLPRLNGAESEPGYQPRNSLLQRVDELKKVKGWEKFTARPIGTRISLFIAATTELISSGPRAMSCSLSPVSTNRSSIAFWSCAAARIKSMARKTIRLRIARCRKGLRSDSLRSNLAQLSGLLRIQDPVIRVVSVGKSGDATRTVQMIIQKSGTRRDEIVGRNFNIEPASEPVFIAPSGRGWNLIRQRGANGTWDVRNVGDLNEAAGSA